MENAADALKIAFAIFVFVVGLAIVFYMSSLCQETATILISETDETKYYSYTDSTSSQGTLIDADGNRLVTIEDIIPTLYRYAEENYGVTIIDGGEIVARFDLDTESAVNSWLSYDDDTKIELIQYINKNVLNFVNNSAGYTRVNLIAERVTDMEYYLKKIYYQPTYNNTDVKGTRREFYCYWASGASSASYTAQRIDSDVSRNYGIL